MVDIPLDHLLEIGTADLHKKSGRVSPASPKRSTRPRPPKRSSPNWPPSTPLPTSSSNAFHDTFDSLITFIRANHIITIPSDIQPTLEETPPLHARPPLKPRWTRPAPFEDPLQEGLLQTSPCLKKDWDSPKHIAEHMAAFKRRHDRPATGVPRGPTPVIYVPVSSGRTSFPSKIRKLVGANTKHRRLGPHYCEQMMLDQGLRRRPPPNANARADQAGPALIRLGPASGCAPPQCPASSSSIKLHTGQFHLRPGRRLLRQGGATSPRSIGHHGDQAWHLRRKPTSTTNLGKLEIMKLREDLKQKEGPAFNLQQFPRRLHAPRASPPSKSSAKAMLHDDSTRPIANAKREKSPLHGRQPLRGVSWDYRAVPPACRHRSFYADPTGGTNAKRALHTTKWSPPRAGAFAS